MKVTLIETGVANVASVRAALGRLGADVVRGEGPDQVATADAVVLPGVGSFASGTRSLEAQDLVESIRERAEANRPMLAVCLGLQLLANSSDESPDSAGIGVLPVRVARLDAAPRLPHFGWNGVEIEGGAILASGEAYFAHSFAIHAADGDQRSALLADGWKVATCTEGVPFVAGVERGAVAACQFHPELSGSYGAALLGRWLDTARNVTRRTAIWS